MSDRLPKRSKWPERSARYQSCATLIWYKSYNFRTHWIGSYKLSNPTQRVKRPIDLDRLGESLLHQASPIPTLPSIFGGTSDIRRDWETPRGEKKSGCLYSKIFGPYQRVSWYVPRRKLSTKRDNRKFSNDGSEITKAQDTHTHTHTHTHTYIYIYIYIWGVSHQDNTLKSNNLRK